MPLPNLGVGARDVAEGLDEGAQFLWKSVHSVHDRGMACVSCSGVLVGVLVGISCVKGVQRLAGLVRGNVVQSFKGVEVRRRNGHEKHGV